MSKNSSVQEKCPEGEGGQSSQVPEASTESTRSNSPLRRKLHIRSEQRRREKITDGFQRLKRCVPSVKPDHDSKALILKKSAEYIELLEYELTTLKQENAKISQQLAAASLPHQEHHTHAQHSHTQHYVHHQSEFQHQRHPNQTQSQVHQSPTQPQSQAPHQNRQPPHYHHQQQHPIPQPTQHQPQIHQQYAQIPPVSIAPSSFPSSYPSYAPHQVLPAFPYGSPQLSRNPTLGPNPLPPATTLKFDPFYPPTAPTSRHITDEKGSKSPQNPPRN
ncbi:BA75_01418T0 [Komagataella pastoris]|uniref:BA75_01418T0 n=1 Tax=Komagataella pastoris TaxID=4922 RepID=A0A1B2J9E8_PICPA|nr:BA75_01418T0 [Komagataella pastoris]